MAMSDTCYEKLDDLSGDLMHYINWGYDDKDLSLVVDAMYSLAKFGILHGNFNRPSEEWLEEATHRLVISSMLEDMELDNVDAACGRIASIARRNATLAKGVEYFLKTMQPNSGIFDAVAEPVLRERLGKIADYNNKQ